MKLLNLRFHRSVASQCRKYGQKTATKKKLEKLGDARVSADIYKYFQSDNKLDVLKLFPEKLFRRKQKLPLTYYIANENTAKLIADTVTRNLPKGMTLAEINPGPGLLTKELLNRDVSKLVLFESSSEFRGNLEEFHVQEPDRVKVHIADFLSLWKLHFQDKLDSGSRLDWLLRDVPRKDYCDGRHLELINSDSLFEISEPENPQVSRREYATRCSGWIQRLLQAFDKLADFPDEYHYLWSKDYTPGKIHALFLQHLTCYNDIGYLSYRAMSFLFQIMFEYRFIARLPREHFLPWKYQKNLSTGNKLTKVKSINSDFLYLVKIVPRKNLYDLCPPEDMPALWYFIKQNCISRKNRIIPNLERWIPGCGSRLIINLNVPEQRVQQLYPDEDIGNLPPFSKPCTTMSTRDYYPDMNIFTEFGDLTPSQMLSLFSQFKSWPEYKESLFLASLENSLLKLETSNEERVDGLDIPEEDDLSLDSNSENLQEETSEQETKRGRNKKS